MSMCVQFSYFLNSGLNVWFAMELCNWKGYQVIRYLVLLHNL